uniref:Uncharacterized protein n=1 Tax=viral metagenome TaxID=1070528 RepID=A0A6M3LH85_9ZZZZ
MGRSLEGNREKSDGGEMKFEERKKIVDAIQWTGKNILDIKDEYFGKDCSIRECDNALLIHDINSTILYAIPLGWWITREKLEGKLKYYDPYTFRKTYIQIK